MKLYFKFFAMHLKSRMAYKKSFFFAVIGQFLTSFSAFMVVFFLLDRFETVKGYTLGEVLLCASVMWMAFSLAEGFFRGFDQFPNVIRSAEFDRLLVRPRGLIFQVLCHHGHYRNRLNIQIHKHHFSIFYYHFCFSKCFYNMMIFDHTLT